MILGHICCFLRVQGATLSTKIWSLSSFLIPGLSENPHSEDLFRSQHSLCPNHCYSWNLQSSTLFPVIVHASQLNNEKCIGKIEFSGYIFLERPSSLKSMRLSLSISVSQLIWIQVQPSDTVRRPLRVASQQMKTSHPFGITGPSRPAKAVYFIVAHLCSISLNSNNPVHLSWKDPQCTGCCETADSRQFLTSGQDFWFQCWGSNPGPHIG